MGVNRLAAYPAPAPEESATVLNSTFDPSAPCGRPARAFPALAALAFVAPLGLAGCATSLAPPYQAPALPVPAVYGETARDLAGAAPPDWRSYFFDPQLRGLIERALTDNRDLRAALLRVEQARAAYRIERADRVPSVDLGAAVTRDRTPADLSLTRRPVVVTQWQAQLELGWELDFWGRVRSLNDAALERYLATDAARRAVALTLVTQVADAYLVLRELDQRLALARRTIASREASWRIFARREALGATSRLDLTQIQTLLAQAQSLGVQLELSRAEQAHALVLLIGAPIDVAPADEAVMDGAMMPDLDPGLPSALLANRPDIIAAEHRLRAANADIGAARAAFFPRIALTGALGTASDELEGLFRGANRAWRFIPSLSLPIFDAGRNRAGLDLADTGRQLAVADYERSIQVAFREVSDALAARHWLAAQIDIQQRALAAESERARLAKLRYDHGAAAFLEVLDAQRDLLSAEQQLVQTRRLALSSRVALYAALGGGTQDAATRSGWPAGPAR